MIVRVQVRKHGMTPPPSPEGGRDDWRTNVCMIDYLVVSWCDHWAEQQIVHTEPSGFLRAGGLHYAWSVQEWDGNR